MRRALSICLSAALAACGSEVESRAVPSGSVGTVPSAALIEEPSPPLSSFPIAYGPSALMTLPAGEVPAPRESVQARPGPAYFGVDQVGVVRLGVDGTVRKILSHHHRVHDLVLAPDGRTVWAGGYGGVWRIVGDRAEKVGDISAVEVAPTPDGGVVVLGLKPDQSEPGRVTFELVQGIHRYRDGSWTEVKTYQRTRADGLEAWLLHDVAVDREDRIHLGSSGGWWREHEAEWTRFGTPEPSLETLFFTEITQGNDGVLFGTCNGGLFYVTPDDDMFRVPIDPGEEGFHDVTVAPSGEVALVGDRDQVIRIRPGEAARSKSLHDLDAPGLVVRDVGIDGQSRTWVATDDSVTVLSPDDEVLQHWARGTVPEVRGAVRSLVVLGDGPALPRQHAQVVGTVIGKLTGENARQYRTLTLCLHPAELAAPKAELERTGSLPCDPGAVVGTSEVRRNGEFRFEKVPQGSYWMGADARDFPVHCCTQIDGGVTDLGTIVVPAP